MSTNRLELLGIPIDPVDIGGLFAFVDDRVRRRERATVMYANIHTVNSAVADPALLAAMRGADLLYCDGEGIRKGVALLGGALPPRMTGADWIWDYARFAAARGHRIFWIGAQPGIAEDCMRRLAEHAPGLPVAGSRDGFFDKKGPENDSVVAAINAARPDVLVVGFGTPLQETWIAANRGRLDVPVVWAVGATADFVTGHVPRGPAFLYDTGFEWLARLLVDPRRLWRRYVIGNPLFFARVAAARLRGQRARR